MNYFVLENVINWYRHPNIAGGSVQHPQESNFIVIPKCSGSSHAGCTFSESGITVFSSIRRSAECFLLVCLCVNATKFHAAREPLL